MAGVVRREDLELLRERAVIEDVVGDYVTLRAAGVGSLKGLCPFHDEKTPSFQVRAQVGLYYCFGCSEGGDVFSFLQRIEHVTFVEAVERLAFRFGVELRYEAGGAVGGGSEVGLRQRLYDAHVVAADFYETALGSVEGLVGVGFLGERNFTLDHAKFFGVGYAPSGWGSLLQVLRKRGFSEEDILASGLAVSGRRGLYDRFRGRLVWPIRDTSGAVVGFGARKLSDSDGGPKYLNSPETLIYKKSQLLYGLDLAKRSIARNRRVVVVEGYTDVMACHVSGVDFAVATCGTAFGGGHAGLVRRIVVDDGTARIVFTFDGDVAGRKAALRVFEEDQGFLSQIYVAVDSGGLDPCELWQRDGSVGVVNLLDGQVPLVRFVVDSVLAKYDLSSVDGRVGALRGVVPVLAGVEDRMLREGYVREVAAELLFEEGDVLREVGFVSGGVRGGGVVSGGVRGGGVVVGVSEGQLRVEREGLAVLLQVPDLLGEDLLRIFLEVEFVFESYSVIGGVLCGMVREILVGCGVGFSGWVQRVCDSLGDVGLVGLVQELAVGVLDVDSGEMVVAYGGGVLRKLLSNQFLRRKDELLLKLRSGDFGGDLGVLREVQEEIMEIDRRRISLFE